MAKKKTNLGCLFWLALVLLVVVIFLFNQKNIERVLKGTGFFELFSREEQPVEVTVEPTSQEPENTEQQKPADTISTKTGGADEIVDVAEDKPETQETDPGPSKLRKSRLFLISVDDAGGFELKGVVRSVSYVDSPLKQTLLALLKGPTGTEINQGYLTIIPEGTVLNTVYVKGNTAFIDFSEEFQFNPLGQVGLQAQLQQVVYTATEFNNIDDVQIIIDGEIRRFLSSEGTSIGVPLSRGSFQR
jgi:spore germination protein GerM